MKLWKPVIIASNLRLMALWALKGEWSHVWHLWEDLKFFAREEPWFINKENGR